MYTNAYLYRLYIICAHLLLINVKYLVWYLKKKESMDFKMKSKRNRKHKNSSKPYQIEVKFFYIKNILNFLEFFCYYYKVFFIYSQ